MSSLRPRLLPLAVIVFAGSAWALTHRGTAAPDDKLSLILAARSTHNSTSRGKFPSGSTSFDDFRRAQGRYYQPGTLEYAQRRALFEERLAWVQRHNSQPDRLWEATVNKFADATEEELAELRGYNRHARPQGEVWKAPPQFTGTTSQVLNISNLPAEFTWKNKLSATTHVLDQGSCGSCWAFAAAEVLRAHSELFQSDRTFSTEQIVSCTPNPQECGGKGGCSGATAELAWDYVAKMGCRTAEEMPYTAHDHLCPRDLRVHSSQAGFVETIYSQLGGASFGMTGYHKLPENELEPLLMTLYSQGPVAISIAVTFGWHMYSSGIYNDCDRDAVINHAVMLVGYGQDHGTQRKYWHLQNSWGPVWGEDGYIRILRRDHADEKVYCGTDREPDVGNGCLGGPSEVRVCGSCGILYDTAVPTFHLAEDSYWARTQRR